LFRIDKYDEVGMEAEKAIQLQKDYFELPALSEEFKLEIRKALDNIIVTMRETSAEQRERIYAAMKQNGEVLRQLVE
jgi:hypothetical protein